MMRSSLLLLIAVSITIVCRTTRSQDAATPAKELDGLPLVFHEDFSKDTQRWQMTDSKAWSVKEEDRDGKPNRFLSLQTRISDYQPKYRSPHNIALVKDLDLADVIITVRVRNTADTGGHRDCCIFFCHVDADHFYYVHCGAQPDPASGQIMIVDGKPRSPLTQNKNKIAWSDNWHTLKLIRKSGTGVIQLYFDDMKTPVMEVKDERLKKGRVGIGSFDDKNDFDDVAVYGQAKP